MTTTPPVVPPEASQAPLSERLEAAAVSVIAIEPYSPVFNKEHRMLLREAAVIAKKLEIAPVAIMDTRDALGICAPTEDDFPAIYAMQGKRVALVEVPNV